MTEHFEKLFGLIADAVLCVENGTVRFANAPARALLGAELAGADAAALLPAHMLSFTSERCCGSASIRGRSVDFTATRSGDALLFCLSPSVSDDGVWSMARNLWSNISSSMGTMRIAADRLIGATGAEADPRLRAYASVLYHNYYSLLRTTGNLSVAGELAMDSAVFSPRDTDAVRLCGELTDAVARFLGEERPELSFEAEGGEFIYPLDPELIERLLLNLLANSLGHTGPEGRVTVSVRGLGENLVIAVDDNGRGIPEDTLATVFRRFDRKLTPSELTDGAGLGLYICRGIAALHGGSMLIESREDNGTSVRVMLPPGSVSVSPRFSAAAAEYRAPGPNSILTELSGVLPNEVYSPRFMD